MPTEFIIPALAVGGSLFATIATLWIYLHKTNNVSDASFRNAIFTEIGGMRTWILEIQNRLRECELSRAEQLIKIAELTAQQRINTAIASSAAATATAAAAVATAAVGNNGQQKVGTSPSAVP